MEHVQRVIAAYINGVGAGQYRAVMNGVGVLEICLGLDTLARLTHGADGYLTVEVVHELLRAANARVLDDRCRYRLPLAHPNLFELLLALISL